MRRIGTVVATLVLASSFVAPAARAELPSKQDGQVAFSVFAGPRSGPPVLYVVGAIVVDQVSPQTMAVLGRLPCTKVIRSGKPKLSCKGPTRSVTVLPPDLYVDPLLRNAHLNVDYEGLHTQVDWTASENAAPEYKTSPFVYAGLQADADSSGEVLDHRFSSADETGYSYLVEYALVDTGMHGGINLWQDARGTYHVHAVVPFHRNR